MSLKNRGNADESVSLAANVPPRCSYSPVQFISVKLQVVSSSELALFMSVMLLAVSFVSTQFMSFSPQVVSSSADIPFRFVMPK